MKYEICGNCAEYINHKQKRAKGQADTEFFEICSVCNGDKQPERVSIHSPEQEEESVDNEDEVTDEQEITEEE